MSALAKAVRQYETSAAPLRRARSYIQSRLEYASKRQSRRGLYEFFAGQYAALPHGARVLSVGAGGPINGQLNAAAGERDLAVLTIDVSAERRPDVVGDACRNPFGDGLFDAVVMGEVLEHCHDPFAAVAGARRVLRPGGRLIASTPFIFPIHNRPVDYWRFTRYGLELLLRDFSDVRVAERNSWPESLNVLRSRLYKEPDAASRRLALPMGLWSLALAPLARASGRLIPSDAMTTGYVATATRPTD